VGSVVIAVLLGVVGVELGKESVLRITDPVGLFAPWWVIGVVLATAAIKEWLSRYAISLAQRSGNQAIAADAWHHRSDVFATVLVALGMVGARYGVPWLDGAAGLLVSLLLLWVAYSVAREAIDSLLGAAPDPAEIDRIKRQAAQVEGVLGVHDVVVHRYGTRVFISLHIETSDRSDADALHALANRVERQVAHSGHGSVCVHVDPINIEHPRYDEVRATLLVLVESDPDILSFHDLRLVGNPSHFAIVFDLKLASGVDHREAVRTRIGAALRARFTEADVVVEVDPEFSY
jgi:cation diffusion facilitator family transporter